MRRQSPSSSTTDPVGRYAQAVIAGRILAGPAVRAACRRHLRDLDEQAERGFEWRWPNAERVVRFFATILRFTEGEHAGKPFLLEPSQVFILGSLFGWYGVDGFRRFRVAYIEEGKGNGKSPLAAGIGLYMLVADGEQGAEVYAAATTRDQAQILFRDAVHMSDASPELTHRLVKSGERQVFNLAHIASNSFFKPVSSEGRGLDGKRVHCALIDELHEHPTPIVAEKMRAGTKGRRQALIVEITNSGVDRTTICYQHHEYSKRVVEGLQQDDSWFAYICGLDDDDDPFRNEKCWPKANPLLDVAITRKYLVEQVREAKGMPAKESVVRRLNFCQWVDAASPWIDGYLWLATERDVDLGELKGRTCWGAIDLSSKKDLTALALVFEEADGFSLLVEYWTPGDTVAERARADRVPYDQWAKQGFIHAEPGSTIDLSFVAQRIGEIAALYQLEALAYDPWRIEELAGELVYAGIDAWTWDGPEGPQGDGIKLVRHGQGFTGGAAKNSLWMPRSVDALEQLVLQKKLITARNPVLRWNSASAVLEADARGNRCFTKRKSKGRIDGIVAAAMALGLATGGGEAARSYIEDGEILVI